jgi:glycosyltransferase involved in cell wall biosynthesis
LFIVIICFRHWHLFIVSNPPVATLIPFFLSNKFSLLIFDVFPDAVVESGIAKRGSLLQRIWTRANQKVYTRADHIFTLTDSMKTVLAQYVDIEKIKTVPLWTCNNFLKPVPKNENPFIYDHNLRGKFIILYSGNFGLSHNIEQIIDLASKIADTRTMFVLIGGGSTEKSIKQKLASLNLKNCLILPWQDVKTFPYSLASADLAIVTLNDNASKVAIPSKLFDYLSAGAPILCISGPESELEKIVVTYNIGRSFRPGQIDGMIQYINDLLNDPLSCEMYRKNSLRASSFYTIENVDLITNYYV